jgi:hypothetical protein
MFQLQQFRVQSEWFVSIDNDTVRHGDGIRRQQSQDFTVPGLGSYAAFPEQFQSGFSEDGVADEHKRAEAG